MKTPTLFAVVLLTGAAAFAQYSIDWFKIAGGGGTSSGGNYALSGTIGQADAGGPLTGGTYSLTSGFWSAVTVVQEPNTPILTIVTNPNGSMTVRWPAPFAGHVLQQSTDLTPASWEDSLYPVSDDGTFRFVTFVPNGGRCFFRLRGPN
jgi:hypothetical protein